MDKSKNKLWLDRLEGKRVNHSILFWYNEAHKHADEHGKLAIHRLFVTYMNGIVEERERVRKKALRFFPSMAYIDKVTLEDVFDELVKNNVNAYCQDTETAKQ